MCFIYFVVHRLVAATKSERRKRARFLFIAAPAEYTRKHTYVHTHTCCCRLRLRLRRLSQRWQRHVKMRQKSFHEQLLLTFSFKFRYFSCLLRSATTITNSNNNNNYNKCSAACNDNALDLLSIHQIVLQYMNLERFKRGIWNFIVYKFY